MTLESARLMANMAVQFPIDPTGRIEGFAARRMVEKVKDSVIRTFQWLKNWFLYVFCLGSRPPGYNPVNPQPRPQPPEPNPPDPPFVPGGMPVAPAIQRPTAPQVPAPAAAPNPAAAQHPALPAYPPAPPAAIPHPPPQPQAQPPAPATPTPAPAAAPHPAPPAPAPNPPPLTPPPPYAATVPNQAHGFALPPPAVLPLPPLPALAPLVLALPVPRPPVDVPNLIQNLSNLQADRKQPPGLFTGNRRIEGVHPAVFTDVCALNLIRRVKDLLIANKSLENNAQTKAFIDGAIQEAEWMSRQMNDPNTDLLDVWADKFQELLYLGPFDKDNLIPANPPNSRAVHENGIANLHTNLVNLCIGQSSKFLGAMIIQDNKKHLFLYERSDLTKPRFYHFNFCGPNPAAIEVYDYDSIDNFRRKLLDAIPYDPAKRITEFDIHPFGV